MGASRLAEGKIVSDISAVAEFNSMSEKSCKAVKCLLERTEGSEKEKLENHLKEVSEHLREWPNDSWIYSDDNSEVIRLPDGGYTVRPKSGVTRYTDYD
jgi:chromosome condensin MukBEF MukE localization factor